MEMEGCFIFQCGSLSWIKCGILKLKILVDRSNPRTELCFLFPSQLCWEDTLHTLSLGVSTDPTSWFRWAQQTLHVDTCREIIQYVCKTHQCLAVNTEALGVTSYNLQAALIALRPPGWTKKGIHLHHTWGLLAGVRQCWPFPCCRAMISSWHPDIEGMWKSGRTAKAWNRRLMCRDERQQAFSASRDCGMA